MEYLLICSLRVLIIGSYDQVSLHGCLSYLQQTSSPLQPAVNVRGWWGAVSCRNTFILETRRVTQRILLILEA